MGFGDIIKRSWKITWRYRALWVLGLFAGVTGASSGGGSSGGGNLGSNSGSSGGLPSGMDLQGLRSGFERLLPLIIVVTLGIVVISLVWWILSVAARGGLVHAVNAIEQGEPLSLGAAWNAGFRRFGSLFGLGLLLALPVAVIGLLMAAVILLPIVIPLLRGDTPSAAAVVPVCGSLIIGVPVLIVLSVVIGIMQELGLRFVMLYDMRAVAAIGESWRAFRGRLKDTLLIWLINLGLNLAAGLALAIPLIIIVVALIIPSVVAGVAGKWGALAAMLAVLFVLMMAISLFFTAVWGTFTSTLWTIFFRRFTGMEVLAEPSAQQPPLAPAPPDPPAVPQPKLEPAPSATPLAVPPVIPAADPAP